MLAIAGILAAGVGIGILIGSWIPLLIAMIASLLLSITTATGHGQELISGVKETLQGFMTSLLESLPEIRSAQRKESRESFPG